MRNIGLNLRGHLKVEQNMPDELNTRLRAEGVISENEILIKAGDLFLAYDVVTQSRRKIDTSRISLNENAKVLLRG